MHHAHPSLTDRHDLLEHADWARGLARALVPDAATAEDIAQDALTLALGRPAQPDPRSWLAGTLRNLAAQRRRKDFRRVRRERTAAKFEGVRDHAATLGELEAKRRLIDHVMALGERNREVLLWRYFRGETPGAIAARQGRSVASVSNQLTRAHASLRKRLEADGGEGAWLTALVPLLKSRAAAWGATSETAAAAGFGPLAAAAWTLGKIVLTVGLVGSIWAGIVALTVAPTPTLGAARSDELGRQGSTLAEGASPLGPEADRARIAANVAAPEATPAAAALHSGELTVQLLDTSGAPVTGATLQLKPWKGNILEATTDDHGRARWDWAPANSVLSVGLELNGRQWNDPIARLQLEPGMPASVSWTVHVASTIRGVAVDEGGARLAGQPLQLLARKESGPAFGYHPSWEDVYATTVTDEAGRFSFPPQMAGRYALFPTRCPSDWSKNFMGPEELEEAEKVCALFEGKTELANYEVCFDVPYNVGVVHVDATFYTDGAIRGQMVEAASGLPVGGKASLSLGKAGHRGSISLETDEEGAFVTPPLPPGQYRLMGYMGASGWCPPEPVSVARGASDVKLPVSEAASTKVRLEFAAGVDPAAGVIRIGPPRSERALRNGGHHILEMGQDECEETKLRPGRYGFSFVAEDGSCAGSVAPFELSAGRLPGGVVIPVVPAATVNVTNGSSEAVARVTLFVETVSFNVVSIVPGDTASVPVPPGNVTLLISVDDQGREESISLKAVSGEAVTVDWK